MSEKNNENDVSWNDLLNEEPSNAKESSKPSEFEGIQDETMKEIDAELEKVNEEIIKTKKTRKKASKLKKTPMDDSDSEQSEFKSPEILTEESLLKELAKLQSIKGVKPLIAWFYHTTEANVHKIDFENAKVTRLPPVHAIVLLYRALLKGGYI